MHIQLVVAPRKNWVSPDERGPIGLSWERIPWWKPEAWFQPADKHSHWGAGLGWLWITLRAGGGGR